MSAQLPQLLDRKGIMAELGVSRAFAERIMRGVPKITVPGFRKVYVQRDEVARWLKEHKRAA